MSKNSNSKGGPYYILHDITTEDAAQGKVLGEEVGDVCINTFQETPEEQWTYITQALRINGYKIVKESI